MNADASLGLAALLRRPAVQLALLAALCAAVYANSFGNGFHLDDFYRVHGNPHVTRLSPVTRFFGDPSTSATLPRLQQYRPLLTLSLAIDHAIAGHHSVVAYHVTNLLWLILGALWLYLALLGLLERGVVGDLAPDTRAGVAWIVAALYAVHPVSGVAVNYICARDLLMMQALLWLSLWAYLGVDARGASRRRRAAMWALSLAALAASLLAKQNAVVTPLLVLAIELFVHDQPARSLRPWRRAATFAAVVGAFFVLTEVVLGFSDLANVTATTSRLTYALTQVKLHVFHYLRNAVYPWALHVDPLVEPASGLEVGVVVGALVLLGSLVLAWRVRRRSPLLSLCIVGYWTLIAPTSSLLPLHAYAVDYRALPAQPFLWLAAALLCVAHLPSRARWAVAALALGYFATASVLHNTSWRDEQTLWRRAVRLGGGALAHHNLAVALRGDKTIHERIRLLRRALELSPNYVLAHINLCQALVHKRRFKLGLASCSTALKLGPKDPQVHFWIGYTYFRLGDKRRTAWFYRRAATLDPKNALYQYRAGRALQMLRREAESLPFLQRAWAVNPRHRDTGYLLGWAYQRLGQRARAIAIYQRFASFSPRHAQARFNLAYALMKAGRCRDAVGHFEAVLRLQPSYAEARRHLVWCRAAVAKGAGTKPAAGKPARTKR